MTGGVGHDQLKRFYKYHFIGANPPDTKLVPVSRTVGTDSLVDEMLFSFTHTSEIDWMLPGVPPTGRKVEVPVVAIVQFRDGKLMSTSTGIRPPFLCRSACSIPTSCRSLAWRKRERWRIRPCRAMRLCRIGRRATESRFN
jgi:SnoaL-like domain